MNLPSQQLAQPTIFKFGSQEQSQHGNHENNFNAGNYIFNNKFGSQEEFQHGNH